MRIVQEIFLTLNRIMKGLRRRLRGLYYSRVLKSMGKGCVICDGVIIAGHEKVSLGDQVVVNEGVILQSCEGARITIGDCVVLSYRASLITGGLKGAGDYPQHGSHQAAPIIIKERAWIGAGAIVLPGVTVGADAVVAAGSIVSRDVPDHMIVGGVPAKVIPT